MTTTLLFRVRADIVFAVLLVMRNRTVRLSCLLSLVMVFTSLVGYWGQVPRADQQTTVFLIAGTLSAVIGSRLLAPGAAIAASRQVAARCWLVPLGRLTGGLSLVFPIIAVAVFALRPVDVAPLRLSLVAAIFAAAVASAVLTLAPAIGGSAAAVVGFLAVWAGVVSPADLHAVSERWPFINRTLVMLWHLVPLQWRADSLVEEFSWINSFVLIGWTVFGVVLAGWVTTPVRITSSWLRGGEWRF